MSRFFITVLALVLLVIYRTELIATAASVVPDTTLQYKELSKPFILSPPKVDGPVIVHARFDLYDINEINNEAETFQFTGALTLKWHDPRNAFDPDTEGVDEKIFQGNYQFDEISPGWYPQVVLVNESGLFETSGVILRVQTDGTSTLIQKLDANAESKLNMSRYPFDEHRLEAVFEILGFDKNEVLFNVDSDSDNLQENNVWVHQWTIKEVRTFVRDRNLSYSFHGGVSSVFVLSVDVKRHPFYTIRLVVLPLSVIVLLSFSVFWMDRSSLGDRVNVSFIGILTGVAYFLVMSDQLPRISYVTLIHGFLGLSLIIMCTTVVINLVVGAMDKRGKSGLGDSIDYHCRWIFPLVYFVLIFIMYIASIIFF